MISTFKKMNFMYKFWLIIKLICNSLNTILFNMCVLQWLGGMEGNQSLNLELFLIYFIPLSKRTGGTFGGIFYSTALTTLYIWNKFRKWETASKQGSSNPFSVSLMNKPCFGSKITEHGLRMRKNWFRHVQTYLPMKNWSI